MSMRKKKNTEKTGIARLLELAGSRKKQLAAACTLSVLSSAARLVPFFTVYALLCEIILHLDNLAGVDTAAVRTLVWLTLGAALAYGVCAFSSSYLAHTAAYNILYEIRMKLMAKMGRVSAGYFTSTTQGAVQKVISDDVEQVEAFIAHHVCDIAAAVSLPFFTFLYLFAMDWRLALCTLAPVVIGLGISMGTLASPAGAQTQVDMHDKREALSGTIVEYVHGMPVIKIFNRTLGAFQRFVDNVRAYVASVEKTTYFFAGKMGFYYAGFGAQMLFLLPAGLLIATHSASYVGFLPVLLLFFVVGSGLKEPLENMMQMVLSMNRINEGVVRIDRILSQPEIATPAAPKTPHGTGITFEGVSFAYEAGGENALEDVSFSLREGSITGLVGPSGGGKSTIAQLLLRFYDVGQGSIRIGGVDIRDIDQDALAEMMSYVFQDSYLFADTVENNIRMGNSRASQAEVEAAAKAAHIHDVILALPNGYETVIGEDDAYLSGGEQQRIAIARVLLKDTPIVVLDEATAYADAENETRIQQAFARLAKEKTVIVIAHRLKTIQNADQILVMAQGRLVDCGTHEALMARSTVYRNMVLANERRDAWQIGEGGIV